MKILIFGGNGFLGQALGKLFARENIEYSTASRANSNSNYQINISNFEDFKKLPLNYYDVIINCATVLPGGNFLDSEYLEKLFKTNILGSQNICKWIDGQTEVRNIINCSTLVVVAKPWPVSLTEEEATYPTGNHVLYCSSKLTQELIFKTFADGKNICLSQIRFSALYGEKMPWSGIICSLIDQARSNGEIILRNGNKVSADFLHVEDAAKIILSSIKNDYNGILNAASGEEVSLFKLASIIAAELDGSIGLKNSDEMDVDENRSNVKIDKLNKIIDSGGFISINEGVKKMLSV